MTALIISSKAAATTTLPRVLGMSVRTAHHAATTMVPAPAAQVDWDKVKRDQARRARLAAHATTPVVVAAARDTVDWDRVKRDQARRMRLSAHAMHRVPKPSAV